MYCVGKVLGVDDEFNLCSGSLIECKEYCNDILVCDSEKNSSGIFVWMTSCNFFLKLRVFRPAMIDVSKPEKDLASHLLNGMHLFNPAIDPEAYLHWTRRVFGSVSNEKIPKFTSFFSRWEYTKSYWASFVYKEPSLFRIMFYFHCYFFDHIMHIWVLRNIFILPLMNGLMRLNIYLANYLKEDIVRKNSKSFEMWMNKLILCIYAASLNLNSLFCGHNIYIA